MTHYDRAELDALKQSIDLADYARHVGVALSPVGSKYRGNCPLPGHADTTPSFYVNTTDQFYHCFGCGCSGDIYELNKQLYADDFCQSVERVKSYAQGNSGIRITAQAPTTAPFRLDREDRKLLEHVVSHYHNQFKRSSEAQAYLHSRQIDDSVFEKFEIGFGIGYLSRRFPRSTKSLQKMGLVTERRADCFYRHITVPIREGTGKISQLYGRGIDSKRHRYIGIPHQSVFNPVALSSPQIVLCESVLDALTLYPFIPEVTAVYGANGLKPSFASQIASAGVKKVVFAYDSDDAGHRGAKAGAELLRSYGVDCYRIQLPDGMDVNDVLRRSSFTESDLHKLYRQAERMIP